MRDRIIKKWFAFLNVRDRAGYSIIFFLFVTSLNYGMQGFVLKHQRANLLKFKKKIKKIVYIF